MTPFPFPIDAAPLAGNVPARVLIADREQWLGTAAAMKNAEAVLLALWGTDDRDRDGRFRIRAAYRLQREVIVVEHPVPATAPSYPGLADRFPVAGRLQRAAADLLGIVAEGGDPRGWLQHGGWPKEAFPLRRDSGPLARTAASEPYAFVSVSGD